MMIQALLMGSTGTFWILARLFQPMPAWAVPAMWAGVIAMATGPYLLGLPTAVMEEAILPAAAGFAGGEWMTGAILVRRLKIQQATEQVSKSAPRRKRREQD